VLKRRKTVMQHSPPVSSLYFVYLPENGMFVFGAENSKKERKKGNQERTFDSKVLEEERKKSERALSRLCTATPTAPEGCLTR
jgi:hypothetical protein